MSGDNAIDTPRTTMNSVQLKSLLKKLNRTKTVIRTTIKNTTTTAKVVKTTMTNTTTTKTTIVAAKVRVKKTEKE